MPISPVPTVSVTASAGDPLRPGAELLRPVSPFDRLDSRLLSRLDAISEFREFGSETELCTQGDVPAVLHVLLDGQVALSGTAPDGSQAVLEIVHPGPCASFVLAAVLTDQPYLMTATTITDARVLLLRAGPLRSLIRTEPEIALALLGTVARDFRAMVRQVRDLKLRTATQRLGCYLLALVADPEAASARLRLPFDKALLAGRLGCRQDSLSRAFAMLRELGVETHGSSVVLHDIPRLKAYAMPDELNDQTPS